MFQQGFFQMDSNLSPEEVEARRAVLSRMMARPTPRYAGEGLARLGSGILAGFGNRKLNTIERTGRKGAEAAISNADRLRGMVTGQAPTGPLTGPLTVLGPVETSTLDGPQRIADDAMTAVGKQPNSVEGKIRQGLVARGLPEHVADAFILNARDESNLRTDINEIAPIVPGSRGGFGLMQWTGPRRRALEAFAQQRGTDVSDLDTQLDFLMAELQGPEARAGNVIMSSKDTPTAAAAIVNEFLRPAEQHRARREAAYLGGRPAGGWNSALDAYREALRNPWLSASQRQYVMDTISQMERDPDPMRALELERAQLEVEALRNPQPEQTDDMREYAFARSQGYPGTFQDFMTEMRRAGATNVTTTVGGEPQPQIGTVPQGYAVIEDPNEPSGYRMVPIPGGPEDTSATDARREGTRATESDIVATAASRAREAYNARSVGGVAGRVAAMNPESQNAELYRQVDVLRAQAQLGNLTAMREASPTGGALGSVTEGELKILADKSGALDPASPNFLRDLEDYERTLLRTIHGQEAGDRIFEATRGGGTDAEGWTEVDGVKIRVKR